MGQTSFYLDSSVWNAAFDDHVPELQSETIHFFSRLRDESDCLAHVSDVVLQELANAPQSRKELLAGLLRNVEPIRLDLNEESGNLARAYIDHGILKSGHLADARHVAIATVAQVDVIVSWNYRHLVNRRRREAFNGVNAILGYRPIEIVSPPEVFDE